MRKIIGHKYFWYVIIAIVVIISIYVYTNKKKKEEEIESLLVLLGSTSTDSTVSNPEIAKKEVEYSFTKLPAWDMGLYKSPPKGAVTKVFKYDIDMKNADAIYNSKGIFSDDEHIVLNTIKLYKTKYALSLLSSRFYAKYKVRIQDYIKSFVDKETYLEQIYNHVKALK